MAAYGFTLSGYWSLGKLAAVAICGLWLSLGRVYRRPADVHFLTYLAVIAIATVFSADVWLTVFGMHGTHSLGLIPMLAMIPFWACVDSRDRSGIERGMRIGGAIFALSVLAHFTFFYNSLPTGHRASGLMGGPVYAGALAALCLPFCAGGIERGLMIAALLATGSRGAWLAAATGAAYFSWPALSRRQRFYALAIPAIAIMVSFALRPLSDLGRILVWDAALEAFRARPWFGWGPGNFLMPATIWRNPTWDEAYGVTTQDHAHNLFLEAAATSGVFGLIAICYLLFALWKISDRKVRAAFLGAGIVGMLNPLSVAVKALCFMLAASCTNGVSENDKLKKIFVKSLSVISFFVVALIIHWDRMMTFYSDYPWAFSSVWAAYYIGLIKEIIARPMFKI